MSTVLWANYLDNGTVVSAESDLYSLYKYSDKLDKLCRELGVAPFLDFQDSTDAQFNVSDVDLPEGMQSTDELMALQGVWIEASEALEVLERLEAHIRSENTRFGLVANARDQVLGELAESISFARKAAGIGAKFNFAVIM